MEDALLGFELTPTQVKLTETVLLVVLTLFVRWFIRREMSNRIEDPDLAYRARKTFGYVVSALFVILGILIWLEPLQNIGTFLGLASAGIAIALTDLLRNLAGWLYVIGRRPFRVDDRIEVGDQIGDVIDIRPIATTLLEVGGWVDADQSTGRILHVPNGTFLTKTVKNFTEGFAYLWHEIEVLVTFESDWRRAEEIVFDIAKELTDPVCDQARQDIVQAAKHYKIRYRHFTPIVYVRARDAGVALTARMLVPVRQRRNYDQQLWRRVLDGFAADPDVELAYPTIRMMGPDRPHTYPDARRTGAETVDQTPTDQSWSSTTAEHL